MDSTTTKNLEIFVDNQKPNVNINADITIGRAPLTVNFFSTASDNDGTISKYYWYFGDGNTSEEKNPVHIFEGEDITYEITLSVTDNDGGKSTDTIHISTLSNSPPVAIITSSIREGDAPKAVLFDASNSYDNDGQIVRYSWDYDDGNRYSSPSATANHLFEFPGQYNVVLTVTDNEGATDQVTIQIILY
jgi:PKD repeat protein